MERESSLGIRTEKFGEYEPWKTVKLQREHEDCDVPAFDIATLARLASKHKPTSTRRNLKTSISCCNTSQQPPGAFTLVLQPV